MKLVLMFLLVSSANLFAAREVPITSGKLYVPHGYDTNDKVEVVISGRLPDRCHRSPGHEVEREGDTFTIRLFAYWVPQPQGCEKLSLPYQETISLGVLPSGKYKIHLKGFRVTEDKAEVQIREATSNLQDDFFYGNVLGIKEAEAGRGIELVGTNPLNCFRFDRLDAEIQRSVIVLRPRFVREGKCHEVPSSFSIRYDVPFLPDHPKGLLLHVRIMDGRSYNYIYQNKLY